MVISWNAMMATTYAPVAIQAHATSMEALREHCTNIKIEKFSRRLVLHISNMPERLLFVFSLSRLAQPECIETLRLPLPMRKGRTGIATGSTLPDNGMRIDRTLEEESGRALIDRYPDCQEYACAGSQISLDRRETHSHDVCKSHPMERGLIAGTRDHRCLTDIHSGRFATIQMPDDAHGGRGHIKNGSWRGWRLGRNRCRLDGDIRRLCRSRRNGRRPGFRRRRRFWGWSRSWSMRGRWSYSKRRSGSWRLLITRCSGTSARDQQEGDDRAANHNKQSCSRPHVMPRCAMINVGQKVEMAHR